MPPYLGIVVVWQYLSLCCIRRAPNVSEEESSNALCFYMETKVLDTELFPQYTIADLNCGIKFTAFFSQEKPLQWNEINNHTHIQQFPFHITGNKKSKRVLMLMYRKGIIEPLRIGEPVEWCSHMVVVTKKNGKPHHTIDMQKLNAQCYRETHHCQSPF